MKLSRKDWNNYVARLSAINKTAGRKMQAWINKHGTDDVEVLVEVAYALATKYGEASSAVACQMYDEIAEIQKANVPPAVPKAPQHINYVNQAIRSTLDRAPSLVPSTVSELVKRTGAETTLKNAKRDGAYFAWVPNGDTCAFCMTLASNGWRKASKKTINGDHAEHIHKNCNCEFAISFNGPGQIEGYDPDKYLEMYEGAEGANWKEKVNSMRRADYAINKDFINAQKRAAYAARKEGVSYGGYPRGWERFEEESLDDTLKMVNPNFKETIPNHLVGTMDDYTNNCTNSVVAYEMRMRGFDVTACSVGENRRLKHAPFSAWKSDDVCTTTGNGLQDIEEFLKGKKNGTRIEISVDFKSRPYYNDHEGHVFVAERRDGKTIYLDPQSGRKVDTSIFDHVVNGKTKFMRIDNVEPSDRGISACKKVM